MKTVDAYRGFRDGYRGFRELSEEAKKIKFTVQIEKIITVEDVENIMITAVEGGIGYWANLLDDGIDFTNKPNGFPVSQYATALLICGSEIMFQDAEDEEEGEIWGLTIDKLLSGITQNIKERPHDCDLENMDAITADCIIQYALFGEIVYG